MSKGSVLLGPKELLYKANAPKFGGVMDLSNTKKQTQRICQNEDIEEFIPNKRIHLKYIPNKRKKQLKETKISNFLDNDFKVVIIKMFRELRRRMDEHCKDFKS